MPRAGVSGTLYLFRIEDGKIAEFWTEWDNINFMTQLGHYPPAPERKG